MTINHKFINAYLISSLWFSISMTRKKVVQRGWGGGGVGGSDTVHE